MRHVTAIVTHLVPQVLAALVILANREASAAPEVELADPQAVVSPRRVVVSIENHTLTLIEEGKSTCTYTVAVGKPSTPSPVGAFTIVNRVENPTYYHSGIVIEPGPDNPLGTRWIGLSASGYGIHGTNVPSSIGKSASHGCIRMNQEDLEQLFTRVRIGDVVEIVQ